MAGVIRMRSPLASVKTLLSSSTVCGAGGMGCPMPSVSAACKAGGRRRAACCCAAANTAAAEAAAAPRSPAPHVQVFNPDGVHWAVQHDPRVLVLGLGSPAPQHLRHQGGKGISAGRKPFMEALHGHGQQQQRQQQRQRQHASATHRKHAVGPVACNAAAGPKAHASQSPGHTSQAAQCTAKHVPLAHTQTGAAPAHPWRRPCGQTSGAR